MYGATQIVSLQHVVEFRQLGRFNDEKLIIPRNPKGGAAAGIVVAAGRRRIEFPAATAARYPRTTSFIPLPAILSRFLNPLRLVHIIFKGVRAPSKSLK